MSRTAAADAGGSVWKAHCVSEADCIALRFTVVKFITLAGTVVETKRENVKLADHTMSTANEFAGLYTVGSKDSGGT